MILPAIVIFTIVLIVPITLGFLLSFTNWFKEQLMFEGKWIGFNNYKIALTDQKFISSIWYTAGFSVLCLIFVNLFGFGFAYALNKKIHGKNIFRGIFFLPNMVGGLILGYLWQIIFDRVLNEIFGHSLRFGTRLEAMFAMAIVFTWQMAGYVMIIYIAALQNINKFLSEAARIEGCGPFKHFFSVVLPAIMPAITVVLFLIISRSFQMFDQNLALTNGDRDTGLLAYNIYASAYVQAYKQNFGIAQAKSFIFVILVAIISVSQVYISKKFEVQT
ncbi:carbohydrate ABC transporter permease [Mesomycoplasma neurolyticum]|uniref:sn-glycerol-3-phosphate transport system permease protein ugpA n=1 Tax=Mesomycoplasma neurolyticum TaxID=2120 RepID=A0A449A4V0_9BACT|nr:sugar ABC transporter permease [Mesomycoplasma neurolyticum]VEU59281.1 sn-glycerol-3-phosphate transport system permease protein ugpA [Mesomycoplasma neurolyticum]